MVRNNESTIAMYIFLVILTLLLTSCSQILPADTAVTETITLRLAMLPILDGLPVFVAQEEGLFDKYGVGVELIPVGSGAERDQLISSGQADGMLNELLSVMLYNQEQTRVQVVRYAREATPDIALFRILAAGNSEISSVNDLKGVEIGISEGTVIDYLTHRMLQEEGFSENEIKTIAVPKIPDRMALLDSGELKAAMLPEPLSSLAEQGGAISILEDSKYPQLSYTTITFRKDTIDQHPEAIRGFLAAIEEAINMINNDPEKYNTLLSDLKIVPPPLLESFKIPPITSAAVPNQGQWEDVLEWAKAKGLIQTDLLYEESVNPNFLP